MCRDFGKPWSLNMSSTFQHHDHPSQHFKLYSHYLRILWEYKLLDCEEDKG